MKLAFRCGLFTMAIMAIAGTNGSASAQERKLTEKNVPAAVVSAFKAAYPNATIVGFAREKENGKVFYEIESKEGDVGRDVLYNPDGSVAEIEETIAAGDLPSAIQDMMRLKYARAVIMKAEKTTAGEKVGYEVIAKLGKKRITFEFESDGRLKTK